MIWGMGKRRKYVLLLFAIVLAAVGLGVAFIPSGEPSYGGKRLSEWVELLPADASPNGKSEAEGAVRHIGTNALPFLLDWIQVEPSLLRIKFEAPVNKFLKRINPAWSLSMKKYLRARNAMKALQALGPQAKAVIGELSRLLNDTNAPRTMYRAACAMPYLGKDALPVMIGALRSQHEVIRRLAASKLEGLGTNARPAVPELIGFLNGPDEHIAYGASYALACCGVEPKLVLPALTNCLHDTRLSIRHSAIILLGNLGLRKEPAAVPMLLECLDDRDARIAATAANVLGENKMDSRLVIPALTHSLQDSNSVLRLCAARGLGEFGSEARSAVPAMLTLLQDRENQVRVIATNALKAIDPQVLEKTTAP